MTQTAKKNSGEEMTFEQALAQLEGLVALLEKGDVPLKELVIQYQRGTQLLELCQTELSGAQRVIAQIDGHNS